MVRDEENNKNIERTNLANQSKLKEWFGEWIKEGRSNLCALLSKKIVDILMASDRCKSTYRVVFLKFGKSVL